MSRAKVNKDFKVAKLSDLPLGTYGEAMHLVETTEGWRNVRPVIETEKCIHCNWCYFVCPEGVVYEKQGEMTIDYRFCKGCGICAKECKKTCIEMVKEGEPNE